MSTSWLKLLPLALQDVTDFFEPIDEFDSRQECYAGEMSEDLKRLYTLWQHCLKSAMQQGVDARFARSRNEREYSLGAFVEFSAKAKALEGIFWISVRDTFSLWSKSDIGIRSGFMVVYRAGQEIINIYDFQQGSQ